MLSPSIFAYCKQSKTGAEEGLRLSMRCHAQTALYIIAKWSKHQVLTLKSTFMFSPVGVAWHAIDTDQLN